MLLYILLQNAITTVLSCITLSPVVETSVAPIFLLFLIGLLLFVFLQILSYCFYFMKTNPWHIINYCFIVATLFLMQMWIAAYVGPKVILAWSVNLILTLGTLIIYTFVFKDGFKMLGSIVTTSIMTILMLVIIILASPLNIPTVLLMFLFMLLANIYIIFSNYLMLEVYADKYEVDEHFWGSVSFYHYFITILVYLVYLCKTTKNVNQGGVETNQREN